MILDSLNNTKKIECLHPLFKKAFDYLKSTDFSKVEDGKHELDGSRLYVSVVSIFGKEKKDAAIETHKKYIDIQMPLLGVEKIGWKPGCELQEESTPYNEQKDIAFYIDRPTAYTKIYPGQFAIYFPEDGHAPGIGQGNFRLRSSRYSTYAVLLPYRLSSCRLRCSNYIPDQENRSYRINTEMLLHIPRIQHSYFHLRQIHRSSATDLRKRHPVSQHHNYTMSDHRFLLYKIPSSHNLFRLYASL